MMLLRILAYFAFALMFIHGVNVVVRWWQGASLQHWEYVLLGLMPVLMYLFITRCSIFRKDCTACQTIDRHD